MKIVILGAAGAMGRVVVRDLIETSEFSLLLVDLSPAVTELAASLACPRATARQLSDPGRASLVEALAGSFAVINCVQYQANLEVMEAALEAGVHYLDLGGLFHMTVRQLPLDARFREQERLALLGIGGAPGTTNVLARAVAERFDEVQELHIRVAGADSGELSDAMNWSYSIQTILEEGARPAAVLRGGRLDFIPPLQHAEAVDFPAPIGVKRPLYTIHSELATLPAVYPSLQECSFAIAFEPGLTFALKVLGATGINSLEELEFQGRPLIPQEVLLATLRRSPKPTPTASEVEPYGLLRVVGRGRRDGRRLEVIGDCHIHGLPDWGLGTESDTGCPPSIAVQMLARGDLRGRGVLAPEQALDPALYFAELARRNMPVELREQA